MVGHQRRGDGHARILTDQRRDSEGAPAASRHARQQRRPPDTKRRRWDAPSLSEPRPGDRSHVEHDAQGGIDPLAAAVPGRPGKSAEQAELEAARAEIERLRATVTEQAVALHLHLGKSSWA